MLSVYYNEIDPYCATWLKNLMDDGTIPSGDIDTRSIEDVTPRDIAGYDQCHFFAGLGGWAYAIELASWTHRKLWTGSCPCQPFSQAGKGAGTKDERHLWPAWFHLISICQPPIIFGEQVAEAIGHGWLDGAFSDLEGADYACGATVLSASSAHARHRRKRLYFTADTERHEQSRKESRSGSSGRVGRIEQSISWDEPWERALSRFRAMADGLPRSVGATDAARNAIVPQVAAHFIQAYGMTYGET